MKKTSTKILSIFLAVTLILSMCLIAVAEEVEREEVIDSFTISEYDSVMELKQTSDAELKKLGYSTEEIATIKDFSFEKALLERAQLSEEELYNFGYNAEQISLLKSFDGEALENAPHMMAVFGTLTGSIAKVGNPSTNSSKAIFSWEWSHAPLVCGVLQDIVACGFTGTAFGSLPTVITVDERSCVVDYYGNSSKVGSKYPIVNVSAPHGMVNAKFKMVEGFVGQQNAWAKKGSFTVSIKEEDISNNLYSSTYTFAYGHTIIQVNPTVNLIPGSNGLVTLSFNTGVDSIYHHSRTIIYNGSTIFY